MADPNPDATPSLKTRLETAYAEQKAVEERIQGLLRESLTAPEDEKACEDWLAQMVCGDGLSSMPFPMSVHGIAFTSDGPVKPARYGAGTFVAVRPCSGEGKNRTYLGALLGDIATSATARLTRDGVLEIGLSLHNPAIWVPDLRRVVFGMGSWWTALKSPADLKQITNADIKDTWYVKALASVSEPAKGSKTRATKVHYKGAIRWRKDGSLTAVVAAGGAACVTGVQADRIIAAGNHSLDRSKVTCRRCLNAIRHEVNEHDDS